MKSIIAAMREANIKRLVCMTSQYVKPDPNYPIWIKLFLKPIIGRQLDSMYVMENFLFNECSDIDFTIVLYEISLSMNFSINLILLIGKTARLNRQSNMQ